MIEVIVNRSDGSVTAFSAKNSETAEIYKFICEALSPTAISIKEIEHKIAQGLIWCRTAQGNARYSDLKDYGIEINSYDEKYSANKAAKLVSNNSEVSVLSKLRGYLK